MADAAHVAEPVTAAAAEPEPSAVPTSTKAPVDKAEKPAEEPAAPAEVTAS
jgi:hypothetical protein